MSAAGAASAWARDLPVCFPARPCLDYSPFEADAINLTSGLTAASRAIAIGCFALLGAALVLIVLGLSRRSGPSLWVVASTVALVAAGTIVAVVVDLRFSAISAIFGREGPGSPDLFGSWSSVGLAGEAMAVTGSAGLAMTAIVAIVRLRASPRMEGDAPRGQRSTA